MKIIRKKELSDHPTNIEASHEETYLMVFEMEEGIQENHLKSVDDE